MKSSSDIIILYLILSLFLIFLYIFVSKKIYKNFLIKKKFKECEELSDLYLYVLNNVNDGVAVIDADKNILLLNKAFNTNIRSAPFAGNVKNFELMTRNFELNNTVNKFINDKELDKIEKKISYFDRAEERSVQCSIFKINNSNKYAVVTRDITYIQKIENIRSDFIQNISHEIKTPITAIMGFVETLKNGAMDNPDTSIKFLDIIEHHTKRLNFLIDDLIFLTRIETGRSPIKLEEISIKSTIDQSLLLFEKEIKNKKLDIVKNIEDKKFTSDLTKISQIIINLIQNAVKYSNKDGIIKIDGFIMNEKESFDFLSKAGETAVIWRDKNGLEKYRQFLFFSIEDSGIGVSYTNLLRLGERFFRVNSSHITEYKGTGLGLAIIKHTLKLLEGTSVLKSTLGNGFTFSFLIPFNENKEK